MQLFYRKHQQKSRIHFLKSSVEKKQGCDFQFLTKFLVLFPGIYMYIATTTCETSWCITLTKHIAMLEIIYSSLVFCDLTNPTDHEQV